MHLTIDPFLTWSFSWNYCWWLQSLIDVISLSLFLIVMHVKWDKMLLLQLHHQDTYFNNQPKIAANLYTTSKASFFFPTHFFTQMKCYLTRKAYKCSHSTSTNQSSIRSNFFFLLKENHMNVVPGFPYDQVQLSNILVKSCKRHALVSAESMQI